MDIIKPELFEQSIQESLDQGFKGWDFSYIKERWIEALPPWSYFQRSQEVIANAESLLDMGTGGGEYLASLEPLPHITYATESYPPNLPLAKGTLEPLGVKVVTVEDDYQLPFEDNFFDTIINRHEFFIAEEVARILKPGGRFITQQVGEKNLGELNAWLGAERGDRPNRMKKAIKYMEEAGLRISAYAEAFPETAFLDVGAIVYLLKAIPWQVKEFDVETYRTQLAAMHNHIQTTGSLIAYDHRFYIEACKPK